MWLVFYNDDKVFTAKKLLHAYVDSLADKPSSLPRFIVRKSSDNKKKYDCEDMMSLVYALDELSLIHISEPTRPY